MITTYMLNNQKFFEVYVQGRYSDGKRYQKRKRVDLDGKRIKTKKRASEIEFKMKSEMELEINTHKWSFSDWHAEFLKRIRLQYKISTVNSYDGNLKKWLSPEWMKQDMASFKKSDVHKAIFGDLPKLGATAHIQKNTLKKLNRIFEVALDEGIVSKNPVRGLRVQVPAKVQKVLKAEEADLLLKEARACSHALGLRSFYRDQEW